MAKCDLCKSYCSAHDLQQLNRGLRVADVEDICPGCALWVTKVRSNEMSEAIIRTRHSIAERAQVKANSNWWRFISKLRGILWNF